MKVQIELSLEVLAAIKDGKCVEGSLRLQPSSMGTHQEISFKAYNRKPRNQYRDRLIYKTEHGWIKESKERIKLFESVPKELGTPRIIGVIERDVRQGKHALIDREIDMMEFC